MSRAPPQRNLLAPRQHCSPDPGSVTRHRARRDVICSGGAVVLADNGPDPGWSPARPLAREDGSLVEDLAAPDSAWLGALDRAGQADRTQRTLLAVGLGLLKLGGHFGKPKPPSSTLARQRLSQRGMRPGWYSAGSARHEDPRCTVRPGQSGSASRAWGAPPGTAGELLGAHDVAVAWVGRQRLGLPPGWTVALADTDLVHPTLPCSWWWPAPGAAPVRSGRRCPATAGVSLRPQLPCGHPPYSRSLDSGMNVSGRRVHRQMPVQRNPVATDKDQTRLADQPLRRRPSLR